MRPTPLRSRLAGFLLAWVTLPSLFAGPAAAATEAGALRAVGPPVAVALALTHEAQNAEGHALEFLEPDVAMSANGDVLVVWPQYSNDGGDADIYAWLSRGDGTPVTAAPVRLNERTSGYQYVPVAVALAGGGFAVAWASSSSLPCDLCDPPRGIGAVAPGLRLLTADGAPRGAELTLDGTWVPQLLATPDGGLLVVWTGDKQTWAQRRAADGEVLAPRFELVPAGSFPWAPGAAAALADGGIAVTWFRSFDHLVRRYDRHGVPLGPEVPIHEQPGDPVGLRIAATPDGGFALGWVARNASFNGYQAFLRRFDAAGLPFDGKETAVSGESRSQVVEGLLAAATGELRVFTRQSVTPYAGGELFTRAYRADGAPLAPATQLAAGVAAVEVAGDGGSAAVAVWRQPEEEGYEIVFQRYREPCRPSPTVACLGGGRFEVTVDWRHPALGGARAGAEALTADTAVFWFFATSNLELAVKVLDGSAYNRHAWVFVGALSDVEYDVRVRDLSSGAERTYHNPAGTLASRADVTALPLEPTGASLAPAPVARVADQFPATTASVRSEPGATPAPLHPSLSCIADAHTLCLLERFQVTVRFVDPASGQPRAGRAVPLTVESGVFWFFGAANVELVIKLLDARAYNDRFWVFHAALSDVEYTIEVLDTFDGHDVWRYHNPRGRLFSGADVAAF